MKVTRVPPGTLGPCFGGGKGFLTPFRPEPTNSSDDLSSARLKCLESVLSSDYDPIELEMRENPLLKRETAEQMAREFGFEVAEYPAEKAIEAKQGKASPAEPRSTSAEKANDALERLLFGAHGPLPME